MPRSALLVEGWLSHESVLLPAEDRPDEAGGLPAIRCATSYHPWAGALYGCTGPNSCDGMTLPCEPNTKYEVFVWVKGLSGYDGTSLFQLHAVGNAGENFGAAKSILAGNWTKISRQFTTKSQTRFLGIQVVKRDHPAMAEFLIVGPALTVLE